MIIEEVERTGIHVMKLVEKGGPAERSALKIVAEYLRIVIE